MRHTLRTVSLLLTSAILAGTAWAAEPVKIPLTPTPLVELNLQTPRMMRPDATFGEVAKFPPGTTTAAFTLGGEKITVLRNGTDNLSLQTLSNTYDLLKKPNDSCGRQRVDLTLAENRRYTLAFPHAHFYAPQNNENPSSSELYLASGQILVGTVGGQSISLFDDNVDGFYTLEDAICTSNSAAKIYLPLSKFFATPKGIYEINSLAKNGAELKYTPYAGATAPLTVSTTSQAGDFQVVLASKDAQLNVLASTTAKSPAQLAGIPGSYQIAYGLVYSPKNNTTIAQIQAGKSAPLTLAAKESPALALTGPITLEFTPTIAGGKLVIKPESFHFRGKAGEEYAKLQYDTSKPPEISLEVDGKSILTGKMAFG